MLSVPSPPAAFEHLLLTDKPVKDNARSMENARKDSVIGRRVAILVANHVDGAVISAMSKALQAGGASIKIIAPRLGEVVCYEGHNYKGEDECKLIKVDHSLATVSSVLFDAVFIPGGQLSAEILCKDANAVLFVKEAYKHGKAMGACDEGVILLTKAAQFAGTLEGELQAPGVITCEDDTVDNAFIKRLVAAVAQHRFTERTDLESIVA